MVKANHSAEFFFSDDGKFGADEKDIKSRSSKLWKIR